MLRKASKPVTGSDLVSEHEALLAEFDARFGSLATRAAERRAAVEARLAALESEHATIRALEAALL